MLPVFTLLESGLSDGDNNECSKIDIYKVYNLEWGELVQR